MKNNWPVLIVPLLVGGLVAYMLLDDSCLLPGQRAVEEMNVGEVCWVRSSETRFTGWRSNTVNIRRRAKVSATRMDDGLFRCRVERGAQGFVIAMQLVYDPNSEECKYQLVLIN